MEGNPKILNKILIFTMPIFAIVICGLIYVISHSQNEQFVGKTPIQIFCGNESSIKNYDGKIIFNSNCGFCHMPKLEEKKLKNAMKLFQGEKKFYDFITNTALKNTKASVNRYSNNRKFIHEFNLTEKQVNDLKGYLE